jgi:hypothetical protein
VARSTRVGKPRSNLRSLPAAVKRHRRPPVRASRRASFARPGRARVGKVERPTGRTTFPTRPWSGGLRCASGRLSAGIPERPGPGRAALAAGGRLRVVGPEALPAGGTDRGYACRRNNQRGLTPPCLSTCSHRSRGWYEPGTPCPTADQNTRESVMCPLAVCHTTPGCSSRSAPNPAVARPRRWYSSTVYGLSTQPRLQYGQTMYSTTNASSPFRLARLHLHPKYLPETVSGRPRIFRTVTKWRSYAASCRSRYSL